MNKIGSFGLIGLDPSNIAAGGDSVHREAYANAVLDIEKGGQYCVNTNAQNRKRITLTQSFLQSEMPLDVNKTQYRFGILQNDITNGSAGLYNTEQRLNMQDVFYVYRWGYYVKWMNSPSSRTEYQYTYMTYPNPNFFGSSGLNLNQMMGLWTNGVASLTINGNVVTPAWDLKKHLSVPLRQLNTITWPNTDNFFNPFDGKMEGKCDVEPNWIFNGGNNLDFYVNFKEPMSTMGISAQTLRLVAVFEGFLAQNASSIMDAK